MKKAILVVVMSLGFFSLQAIGSDAATSKLSMSLTQTPGGEEPIVTLYGLLKPAKSGVKVTVQIYLDGKWQDTRFSSKSERVGTWQITKVASALNAKVQYRAKAKIGSDNIYSPAKTITVK